MQTTMDTEFARARDTAQMNMGHCYCQLPLAAARTVAMAPSRAGCDGQGFQVGPAGVPVLRARISVYLSS